MATIANLFQRINARFKEQGSMLVRINQQGTKGGVARMNRKANTEIHASERINNGIRLSFSVSQE